MKKILLATTLTLSTFAANAETTYCEELEKLSRTIMTKRQENVPMVDMIKIVGNVEAAKLITMDAYERPRFSVADNKQNAINDFANEWFMVCLSLED